MCSKDGRKQEFAQVFMRLIVESSQNRRISVVDITNAMGCERKTFYYYFENIDDLIIWIFRFALKRMIESEFPSYQHVKPHPDLHDPYEEWPFYVRIEAPGNFLAQGPYFKATTLHWETNREYYTSMFRYDERSYCSLFDYLVKLYTPALKDDISYMLDGRPLSEDVHNFLAEYHVMGIFGRLQWHFARTRKFIMQSDLDPYWNYAHSCMKRTIDRMGKPDDGIDRENRLALESHPGLASGPDVENAALPPW